MDSLVDIQGYMIYLELSYLWQCWSLLRIFTKYFQFHFRKVPMDQMLQESQLLHLFFKLSNILCWSYCPARLVPTKCRIQLLTLHLNSSQSVKVGNLQADFLDLKLDTNQSTYLGYKGLLQWHYFYCCLWQYLKKLRANLSIKAD
jgi:hypothetical protein